MAASNINRVVLTGNLTFDPELRSLSSGTSVCRLRIAVNTRRKDQTTNEWVDKPNYFDVTVWGAQGENCAKFLSKGRPVAIDGRLEWREWVDKDTGKNRSAVDIVADTVQFLGSPRDDNGGGFNGRSDIPADTSDFGPPQQQPAYGQQAAPVGGGAPAAAPTPTGDDDIPF